MDTAAFLDTTFPSKNHRKMVGKEMAYMDNSLDMDSGKMETAVYTLHNFQEKNLKDLQQNYLTMVPQTNL